MTAVDLGPVRYEPPLHTGPPLPWLRTPKVLWTGPRWLRGATRWHRIRSGVQYPHFDHPSYQAWCGQAITPQGRPAATELPADGRPLCGTCEGRAAGAGHPSPISTDVELVFSPDRLTAPRWCPGGAPYGPARHLAEAVAHRVVRCGACGELVPEKRYRCHDYGSGVQAAQHPPGAGLVPGCPLHAWRHLVRTAEGVACQCAGLECTA